MIEEAEPFVTLHHSQRLIALVRTSVLSATMIPRPDHRALIIAQGHEAADDRVGSAGVKPAAPTIYRRVGFLNLRGVIMETEVIHRHAESAIVAKGGLPRGGVHIEVLCA